MARPPCIATGCRREGARRASHYISPGAGHRARHRPRLFGVLAVRPAGSQYFVRRRLRGWCATGATTVQVIDVEQLSAAVEHTELGGSPKIALRMIRRRVPKRGRRVLVRLLGGASGSGGP